MPGRPPCSHQARKSTFKLPFALPLRTALSRLLGQPRPRQHRRTRLGLETLEGRLAPATSVSISDVMVLEPRPGSTGSLDFTLRRTPPHPRRDSLQILWHKEDPRQYMY